MVHARKVDINEEGSQELRVRVDYTRTIRMAGVLPPGTLSKLLWYHYFWLLCDDRLESGIFASLSLVGAPERGQQFAIWRFGVETI